MAQNDQPAPSAGMPTSGTNRPGPMGGLPFVAQPGVTPVRLQIERLGVDAVVEAATFDGDTPSEPSDRSILVWYQRSAPLGVTGVTLIGGSTATTDAGPSAFTRLTEVTIDDVVVITGANSGQFQYQIDRSEVLVTPPDYTALFADTEFERIVLLGWESSYAVAARSGALYLVSGVRTVAPAAEDQARSTSPQTM